ncbi:GNAT family N-acetyltransferase [Synechococcus sp. KORDI-100]|uniref:GNAT family N-acetyltransferase n=1 Tax=Synechococcus sp. KORDI-100 TaxID=1280380 RepID=UPI00138E1FEC|nr:GNAT family protein [Synechococcus sp. KORDI-100]
MQSSRLLLRAVESSDLNSTYLSWLNDPRVNQFLETRFFPQSMGTLQSYWQAHHDNSEVPWFAICLSADGRHIGNIKLGPIHWLHRRADISLFIGDHGCWGNGFASEAIALLRDWAFQELDLQKLNAGVYEGNIGSRRAFEKCGFELEGTLREEVVNHGNRLDIWCLGLPRSRWSPSR